MRKLYLLLLFWAAGQNTLIAQDSFTNFRDEGRAHESVGNLMGATIAFTHAYELKPSDQANLKDLIRLKTRLGDDYGAIKNLTEMTVLDPKNEVWYIQRAIIRNKLGLQHEAFNDVVRACELNPKSFDAWFLRGEYNFINYGQMPEAMEAYETALKLGPDSAQAYNGRGSVRMKFEFYSGALEDLDKAVKYEPEVALYRHNLAIAYLKMIQYQRAFDEMSKACDFEPRNPNHFYGRALIALARKDETQALADLNRALQEAPDFFKAKEERAALREKVGDFKGAITDLKEAYDVSRHYTTGTLYARALLLLDKNPKAALELLNILLPYNHDNAEGYYWRGMANFELKIYTQACLDWDRAEALGHAQATQMKERCKDK